MAEDPGHTPALVHPTSTYISTLVLTRKVDFILPILHSCLGQSLPHIQCVGSLTIISVISHSLHDSFLGPFWRVIISDMYRYFDFEA